MKQTKIVLAYILICAILLITATLGAQGNKEQKDQETKPHRLSEEEIKERTKRWNKNVEQMKKRDATSKFSLPMFVVSNHIYLFEWVEKDTIGDCYLNNLPALRKRSLDKVEIGKTETFYVYLVNLLGGFSRLRASIKENTLFFGGVDETYLKTSVPYPAFLMRWELSELKEVPWGQWPLSDHLHSHGISLEYGRLSPVCTAAQELFFYKEIFYDITAIDKETIELYLAIVPDEDAFKKGNQIKLNLLSRDAGRDLHLTKDGGNVLVWSYDGEKWKYKRTLPLKIEGPFRLIDNANNAIVMQDNKWVLLEDIQGDKPIQKELNQLKNDKPVTILKDLDAGETFLIQGNNLLSLRTKEVVEILQGKDKDKITAIIESLKNIKATDSKDK